MLTRRREARARLRLMKSQLIATPSPGPAEQQQHRIPEAGRHEAQLVPVGPIPLSAAHRLDCMNEGRNGTCASEPMVDGLACQRTFQTS